MQGLWNASQLLLLSLDSQRAGLLECARELKGQYAQCESDRWLHEDMRAMTEFAVQQPAPAPPPDPVATPYISSLGVLERGLMEGHHGSIDVEEIAVWADNVGPG